MSDKKVEKRFNSNHEVRTEGETRKIKGYAAVFNAFAEIGDRFREKIAPGAFAESLSKDDIRALWSHNPDWIIGRNKNGSLKLQEDQHGLGFELELPDTTIGRDTFENVRSGLVTGVSFGFRVLKDSWERGQEGKPHIRTLELVELIEISPVAFPAYEQTHVAARSSEEIIKDIETEWAFNEKESAKPLISELRKKLDHVTLHLNLDL
jgi:HK97 family phage prohead protease